MRFILVKGVLAWGGIMFLVMEVLAVLKEKQRLTLDASLPRLERCLGGGAMVGALLWMSLEARYRKLKGKERGENLAQSDC